MNNDFHYFAFYLVAKHTGELCQNDNSKRHPDEILILALLKHLTGKAYRQFWGWLKWTGRFPRIFRVTVRTVDDRAGGFNGRRVNSKDIRNVTPWF
jgi:predicted DNA-binding transcriptional regulator AlpA